MAKETGEKKLVQATAKTGKVFTPKMRACALRILKSADSAEDFLKRAGIVTKKGNLARAYR